MLHDLCQLRWMGGRTLTPGEEGLASSLQSQDWAARLASMRLYALLQTFKDPADIPGYDGLNAIYLSLHA